MEIECTWMRETNIDWIIHGPAFIVLIINLIFLFSIMLVSTKIENHFPNDCSFKIEKNPFVFLPFVFIWRLKIKVLITKLRSANTVETRQYRKATKALLVLIPLLGITYLVVLAGPTDGVGSYIFVVARAFLLSTQVCFICY